jgi:hypothetical protein
MRRRVTLRACLTSHLFYSSLYYMDEVKSLAVYARLRGILLLPEFDAPGGNLINIVGAAYGARYLSTTNAAVAMMLLQWLLQYSSLLWRLLCLLLQCC